MTGEGNGGGPGFVRRFAAKLPWEALVSVCGAAVLAAGGFLLALGPWNDDEDEPTAAQVAAAELGCAAPDSDRVVTLEGNLKVMDPDADAPEYLETLTVEPGDRVQFQLYLRNRELLRDVENLRARVEQSGNEFEHIVEMHACGSNTRLLQWPAVVRTSEPAELVFRPGTVQIRTHLEGGWVTRGGSDALIEVAGESLGKLPGTTEEYAENTVTVAVVADVAAAP